MDPLTLSSVMLGFAESKKENTVIGKFYLTAFMALKAVPAMIDTKLREP